MIASRLAARVFMAWLAAAAGSAFAQDDPLPPAEVFRYSARADAERVYVDFDVLDGYYLYRTRFGFDSGTDGVALGAARFPRGETHTDEFFGEQEIFRRQFQVVLPYRRTAPATSLDLKLELQGCAPTFCYLPQDWTATVTLPPVPFLGAGSIDTSATGDLLPVDDAFTMNARFDKPNELTVAWQIAPDHYLYRDKLTVAVNGRISLGAPSLPAGEPHTDDNFGDVEVFRDYVEIKGAVRAREPRCARRRDHGGVPGLQRQQHLLSARRAIHVARTAGDERVSGAASGICRRRAGFRAGPVGGADRQRLLA